MPIRSTPNLAELIDSRIIELRRQGTATAKEIAKRAGIKETTLSMIRKGHRGVSPSVAVRVAEALDLDPTGVQQVVTAAGYAPMSLDPTTKPVMSHLLTRDGFLEKVRQLPASASVWSFGLGLIETLDDEFFAVFRENYTRGIQYLFFLSQRNALDFIKLRDLLRLESIELDPSRCNAIVLPDESFHHRDLRLFSCLLQVPGETYRGFTTINEVSGEYLYRELTGADLTDLESYLEQAQRRAKREKSVGPPVLMGEWLRTKGYEVELATV